MQLLLCRHHVRLLDNTQPMRRRHVKLLTNQRAPGAISIRHSNGLCEISKKNALGATATTTTTAVISQWPDRQQHVVATVVVSDCQLQCSTAIS